MISSNINPSLFTKKLNTIVVIVIICAGIIAAPTVWLSSGKPTPLMFAASRAIEIIVWLYLSAILFQFYRRTRLSEYILHSHTFWLAGVIAYPITFILSGVLLLLQGAIQSNVYTFFQWVIPATWFILVLVGKILCTRRTQQMDTETQSNTAIWEQLLNMDMKSIMLLQFPEKD